MKPIRCRRREVLIAAVVASAGALPVITATAEAGPACRGWCLANCDVTCRRGERAACPPLSP